VSGQSIDLVPVEPRALALGRDEIVARLSDLLTRSFYSGSGYVFESEPYVLAEDDDLMQAFAAVRADDRRHAHVLGTLLQARGAVPQPGVFPWWNLDLNYLSVPCLSRFVARSIEEETRLFEALLSEWPSGDAPGRAALEWILSDKKAHLARLRPLSEAALAREGAEAKRKIDAVKTKRTARIAKEKAAAEAAKKAKAAGAKGAVPAAKPTAAPAAAIGDPNEPGISSKEKGRRFVLRARASKGVGAPAAAPVAAAAAVAPAAADLGDPNEPGISPKEKAKRQMARMRAAQGGGTSTPAAAPTPSGPAAADLGDPNEPGISPKEKARRQMARMRAAQGGAAPAAAPAPASPRAPAPAVEDLGDPDEPGISPKEKARRQVARMRARKAGGG
jgi:hypothetical protein